MGIPLLKVVAHPQRILLVLLDLDLNARDGVDGEGHDGGVAYHFFFRTGIFFLCTGVFGFLRTGTFLRLYGITLSSLVV